MPTIDEIKQNIERIEKLWKDDIKKEHGGGLDSKINEEYIRLKIELEKFNKE